MNNEMQPVLECVVFKPTEGTHRDQLVEAAAAINAWAQTQAGFVSRELFEVGDGRWIDTVRWVTMENALAAGQASSESAECGAFFGLIDMESMLMMHATSALVVG